MIENLSHIQPSQQLKDDFLEYIDRQSRSSIHSASDCDPEHEIENETQMFYAFPKDIKRRNLNINVHRKHNIDNKFMYPSNVYHQRNESSDSMASSSPETPHQRNEKDEQEYQMLFEKRPIISQSISNESTVSNLTTILINIKIFDFSDKLNQISDKPQDVWINIKPTDTTINVMNQVLNQIHISNVQLYGNKPEQYQLFYYDDEDEEIRDYLGALKYNDIVASKGVDVVAMKYNCEYSEYEIKFESFDDTFGSLLVIDHSQISVTGHFCYVFEIFDNISEYRWINKKILSIEKNEQIESDCDRLSIQFCANISVVNSDKRMFEINFVLNCDEKCMDKICDDKEAEIGHSLSSSIEFIDIGSYKPENYNELWNPKTIIPKLKQYYNKSYCVRYWTKSVKECAQIVEKIKELISSTGMVN